MDERINLSMSDPDLVPLLIQVFSFLLIIDLRNVILELCSITYFVKKYLNPALWLFHCHPLIFSLGEFSFLGIIYIQTYTISAEIFAMHHNLEVQSRY